MENLLIKRVQSAHLPSEKPLEKRAKPDNIPNPKEIPKELKLLLLQRLETLKELLFNECSLQN